MKAFLKIIALSMPFLMFCQKTDSLAIVAKSTAESVIREQKSIDSIQNLKEQENLKQIRLIKQIRERVVFLKKEKKISISDSYVVESVHQNTNAIKRDNDIIYWEEVKRKWSGRLFNKDSIRVRTFRFENGRKVYLD